VNSSRSAAWPRPTSGVRGLGMAAPEQDAKCSRGLGAAVSERDAVGSLHAGARCGGGSCAGGGGGWD
jgi:hypothetical protein